jgi:hypothetical protein
VHSVGRRGYGAPGTIRVALCGAGTCGPLLDWRPAPRWTWSPEAETSNTASSPGGGRRWPAWATWTLAGIGAAVATGVGVAVVASGALKSPPPETRFVGGGLKTE